MLGIRHLLVANITLLVLFSCSGYGQPRDYQQDGVTFDTGHIRGPHHPRHSRGIPAHNHQHYVPRKHDGGVGYETKLTQDKQLLHDKEHLKEDLGEWAFKDGKEMSPEEMEFHYFKTHDFDNNSMLDGLEILQAISHILPMTEAEVDAQAPAHGGDSHNHPPSSSGGTSGNPGQPTLTEAQREEIKKQKEEDFNYYIDLIDKVLAEDDLNRDGYLSYLEYSIGRRREEEIQRQNIRHNSHVS